MYRAGVTYGRYRGKGPSSEVGDMDSQQLFGGNPIGIAIRLVLLSIVVGVVLSALGIRPEELIYHIEILIRRLYEYGFGWVEWLFRYFLVGAVVVIPIWLITRLVGALRRGKDG